MKVLQHTLDFAKLNQHRHADNGSSRAAVSGCSRLQGLGEGVSRGADTALAVVVTGSY